MHDIFLYNSLSNRKELFKPIQPGRVNIYSCGPTIYDYPHIGNYRSFLFSDLLHRFFKQIGYDVHLVMNLTDIDDKTIRGANQKKISLAEYTNTYEKAFFEDLQSLNFLPAKHYPKATEHIEEMVEMIKKLIEHKHAYYADGSVYFNIASFKDYGKLSNIDVEEQLSGASGRTDHDEYEKENVSDFVLWKNYQKEDGDIYYQTALGKGRPGWHIECSAMSKRYLGEHFDIHTGGVDNRFPHHENEIAQSECAHHSSYVNYWMHAAHLLVEGEKMSKSLGNFYTLRDLLQKNIHPRTIRYMLISTHYRHQYNFTEKGIEGAEKALARIGNFIDTLSRSKKFLIKKPTNIPNTNSTLADTQKNFIEYLCDDLNVSGALGVFFEYLTHAHKQLNTTTPSVTVSEIETIETFLHQVDAFLGIIPFSSTSHDPELTEKIPLELYEILKARDQARKDKNYQRADELRKTINQKGYEIIDTPNGSEIKKLHRQR